MAFKMPTPNSAPTAFNGKLSRNIVFEMIYNMIISQQVFSDLFAGGSYHELVDKFKVDGSEYGDSKLFYSVKTNTVDDWLGDAECAKLLEVKRPEDPACQVVKLDTFKMIWISTDRFVSKQAWGDENTFNSFTAVILAQLRDTKHNYEARLFNTFVGTTETTAGRQSQTVTLPDSSTEDNRKLRAQKIGQKIADIFVDIKDPSGYYNDYGYERSYSPDSLTFVWNADYYNEITKIDLPALFHKDEIVDRLGENVRPRDYFGDTLTTSNLASYSAATPAPGKPINSSTGAYTPGTAHANGKICARYELKLTQGGKVYIVHPHEEIPAGYILKADTIVGTNTDGTTPSIEGLNLFYVVDPKIICKIIGDGAIQYMSAFNSQTEFINPRGKVQNNYLIFGYSSLDQSRLKEKPFITLKEA